MTAGANADGKRSEKIEAEDNLRTVECLRGRLLAERVASRNAKEEAEQMENKLIELEKKLKEESKSWNRAEKRVKFLMKKLESLNISFGSDESEQSGSGFSEKSEISSVVSSVASSSTKEREDKEIDANVTNSTIGDIEESIQNSKSPRGPGKLLQIVGSSAENRDNPATAETTGSSNGVNLPELTILKEEIEEFKEKTEYPTASNKSEQNASPSAKNHDNPAAGETIGSRNGVNLPELTIQKEEIEEFKEKTEYPAVSNKKIEYPTASNKSEQNASPSAKNHDNPAAGETICSKNGVNLPELTIQKEEIEELKEKTENPAVSNKSEQNASPSSTINQYHGSPATMETSNQSESSQKSKKSNSDDHSLRSLFKREKLNEDDDQEQDEQVDNSLALVPVDLPKTKQTIDPAILDATVKEVLDALRNAKQKLQTSIERRRGRMIKVG